MSAPPRTVGFGRPRRGLVPGHDRTSTDECKEARNLKKLQKNTFKISIAKKVKMIRKQKNNDCLTKKHDSSKHLKANKAVTFTN